jgi:hypothetical protein
VLPLTAEIQHNRRGKSYNASASPYINLISLLNVAQPTEMCSSTSTNCPWTLQSYSKRARVTVCFCWQRLNFQYVFMGAPDVMLILPFLSSGLAEYCAVSYAIIREILYPTRADVAFFPEWQSSRFTTVSEPRLSCNGALSRMLEWAARWKSVFKRHEYDVARKAPEGLYMCN